MLNKYHARTTSYHCCKLTNIANIAELCMVETIFHCNKTPPCKRLCIFKYQRVDCSIHYSPSSRLSNHHRRYSLKLEFWYEHFCQAYTIREIPSALCRMQAPLLPQKLWKSCTTIFEHENAHAYSSKICCRNIKHIYVFAAIYW